MSFSKNDVMTEEEFSLLRDLITREFGIMLKGNKRLTIHTRISHRLAIMGLSSYREYYDFIMADKTGEELFILASHMTNNETYFFRERSQLDLFSKLLKEIKKQRQQKNQNVVKILSLGSSSGEEAYSVNIILQESGLFMGDWETKITGIDIDRNSIRKSEEACYSGNSFRTINGDAGLIDKYFTCHGGRYMLKKSLMRNVGFRHGNLIDPAVFEDINDVDVIFCRNVFIYMSDDAADRIIRNLYTSLSDTGYLFIGSSESLIQKTNLFIPEYVSGVIVYRKNPEEQSRV